MCPEREPELQGAERTRVLEGDVHRVQVVLLVRQVPLLMREHVQEVLATPHEHDPAGLGQVQPLVRVDRDRVGPLESRERGSHRRYPGRRQPIRAVDVEPDAALLADVGEPVDRVDRTGERRAGRRDDRDRCDARAEIFVDRGSDAPWIEPPRVVVGERAEVLRPDAEDLDRARDRVVRVLEQ